MKTLLRVKNTIVLTTLMAFSVSSFAAAKSGGGGGGGGEVRESSPAPSYSAPARESAPAPSYSAPARQSAPAPSYSAPVSRPAPVESRPAPAPVSRPEPVASRPSAPSAPVSRPSAPVSRPSAPVSKPSQPAKPVTKPSAPVTKPSAPVTKPSQPAKPISKPTQPSKPITKPTEPTKPVTKPVTKPTEPTKPVTKPTEPTKPVTKPTEPVVKPTKPIAKPTKEVGVNVKNKPTTPVKIVMPTKNVVTYNKPSYLSNPSTVKNLSAAKGRADQFRNDTRVTTIINNNKIVINNYNTTVRNRYTQINQWHNDGYYHNYYRGYWDRGFFGGYFYPVRPCYDLTPYFYYPMVYWMWAPAYDVTYWTTWYGAEDYVSYPVEQFPYVQVYYATEDLRDLAIEISAFPAERQSYFRRGMINLTENLAQSISNDMDVSFSLAQNEVTINHYQNLGNDAIVVEGSVDIDRDAEDIHIHSAFKALLDLDNAGNTLVFMPIDQTPTAADLAALETINDRITALGGNPLQADVEPAVAQADESLAE